MTTLAGQYRDAGEDEKGLSLLRRAEATCAHRAREIPPPIATELRRVITFITGTLMKSLRRHREALRRFQDARETGLSVHGEDSTEVAAACSGMGTAMIALGDVAGAVDVLGTALAIFDRMGLQETPDYATFLHNQGVALGNAGRGWAALTSYERALALRRRLLPPDHPLTASTLANLSNTSFWGTTSRERRLNSRRKTCNDVAKRGAAGRAARYGRGQTARHWRRAASASARITAAGRARPRTGSRATKRSARRCSNVVAGLPRPCTEAGPAHKAWWRGSARGYNGSLSYT